MTLALPSLTDSPAVRRRVLLALRAAVSALALWIAAGWVDLGETVNSLAAAGPMPILTTLGIYLASQGVSAIRWMMIARALGFQLRPRVAVTYYFIGMFFNLLGPSFLGGDVARSLYLARGRERMGAAASTVALDRYVGFVWLVLIGSAALLVLGTFALPLRLVWATHALAIAAVLSWCFLPRLVARRAPTQLLRARTTTSLVSVVFHLMQIGGAIVLLRALSPSTPWRYCFVFHPLVAIVSALPISIAGLGIREAGYVYFLSTVQGASASQAGAFAAAWLAIVTASSAIGGLVFLANGGRVPGYGEEPVRPHHSTQFPRSS